MTTPADPAPEHFVRARKYSVTIAGHETSVRLEPPFWAGLVAGAAERAIPVNALIARIDAARIASPDSPNLASAIRLWVLADAKTALTSAQPSK